MLWATTEDVISSVFSVLDGLWSKLICGLWNAWYLSKGPCLGETILVRCMLLGTVDDLNFSHPNWTSPLIPRQLQKAVPEEDKRKFMSGEWFYEAKSQRHEDRIHGSEVIIASMKQRKPSVVGETKKPTVHTCNLIKCFASKHIKHR